MEPERLSSARTRVGAGDCQEEKTPRSLISAQKCAHKTKKKPEDTKKQGDTQKDKEGELWRRRRGQKLETQPHSGPSGTRLQVEAVRGGGGWFEEWRRKDET